MTNPMIPQTPKKKNFRTWLLEALAVIGAFFAGLFAVRCKDNEADDPHFGEAPSDYLNHVPGAAEPLCTVDIPNLTEAQARALEACYPQAVRVNPKEVHHPAPQPEHRPRYPLPDSQYPFAPGRSHRSHNSGTE